MTRTSYHGCLIALTVAGLFPAQGFTEQPADSDVRTFFPVRGVWVANVGTPTLTTVKGIRDFVNLAHRCEINTLYVVTWNRGMTTYPSEILLRESGLACDPRYQDFDMLQEIINAAHAKNIRVIAWFEFGFSCSYCPGCKQEYL